MAPDQTYDLVCIGNYTKDTIISPSGVKYVDGGAVNYSAHAAHRLGNCVAVVTHLAEEDRRVVDKFRQDGIDCFVTYTPHSTCMRLEYPTHDPDVRTLSVASTAAPIIASELNEIQSKSALIGSSYRGEVGVDVIYALKDRKIFTGVDVQGFVRVLKGQSLAYERWEEMEQILPFVDVLKSDAVEAEYLTGECDIYQAARKLARMGPDEVVLTHKDGVLVLAGGEFLQAGFFSRSMNGRSGRGDTCIGTYMAMRNSLDPFEAGVWAAAVTSLKMEKLGPFDRSKEDVITLIREKYTSSLTESNGRAALPEPP